LIIVGEHGSIMFGGCFLAPLSLRILSFCGIESSDNIIVGWDLNSSDTNFHPLYDIVEKDAEKDL
jgi:hypothetical protein